MTVIELIEILLECDPHLPVLFVDNEPLRNVILSDDKIYLSDFGEYTNG